jgi:TatD DNase family protein
MEMRVLQKGRSIVETEIAEMADAHCHLDLINDPDTIKDSIGKGVRTIITNGVDTKSNMKSIQISDNRHVFAALGVDPEHAAAIGDEELDLNLDMARGNAEKIVAIGEIGLDYKKAGGFELIARQRAVFEKFLELANSLDLPVCVHSRNALDDVLSIIDKKGNGRVHIHFFEGNAQQVKEIERRGYMISVPPLESEKRIKAIREMGIDSIMAESDSPIVGDAPISVRRSIEMIAAAKGISFEKAAGTVTLNTKRFFSIHAKAGLIRH